MQFFLLWCVRLSYVLQVFQQEVREQGATALWALAGHTLKQQKHMAKLIGYNLTLDMLLSSSDKMQYVGKFVTAFTVPKRRKKRKSPRAALLIVSIWGAHKCKVKLSQ